MKKLLNNCWKNEKPSELDSEITLIVTECNEFYWNSLGKQIDKEKFDSINKKED